MNNDLLNQSNFDKEYYFSTDWFTYNIPIWEKYFKDNNLLGREEVKCLEIGCFEGRATLYLLENILTHPTSSIDVIDTFNGSINESGMSNLSLNDLLDRFKYNTRKYNHKINIFIGESYKILKSFDCYPKYDIIYIDGSHIASNIIEDAIMSHHLLKQYGLLIFDDYLWKDNTTTHKLPKIAIDAFITIYDEFYEILWSDYQVICKKKKI
jgi:hypothetical protein